MKKVIFILIFLISLSSVTSNLDSIFTDNLKNLITGKVVKNNPPTVFLGFPSDDQVINTATPTVTWTVFDKQNEQQTAYFIHYQKDDPQLNSPTLVAGLGEAKKQEIVLRNGDGTYYWRVKVKDSSDWSSWSEVRHFYLDTSVKACSDGTLFYECSVNQPAYCDAGVLINDCDKCGCPTGKKCAGTDLCEAETCSDGTLYGQCSKNKPDFCNNGQILKLCSLCNCPIGKECQTNGECKETLIIFTEAPINSKNFIQKITEFFKNLFIILYK